MKLIIAFLLFPLLFVYFLLAEPVGWLFDQIRKAF